MKQFVFLKSRLSDEVEPVVLTFDETVKEMGRRCGFGQKSRVKWLNSLGIGETLSWFCVKRVA